MKSKFTLIQFRVANVICVVALLATPAVRADEASKLLTSMSDAMRGLNYDGTFIYSHGNQLDSLRIIHQASNPNERERLISLNGPPSEIIREGRTIVRVQPGKQVVQINQSYKQRSLIASLPTFDEAIRDYYRIELAGRDRIAGHPTKVINIYPIDEYRYGYRLWLSIESSLLLKMELLNSAGDPLEFIMFTSLNIIEKLNPELISSGIEIPKNQSKQLVEKTGSPKPDSGWMINKMPQGFKLESHRVNHMQGRPQPAEHFLLSDGMAVVSVYIEKLGSESAVSGGTNIGAVHTFGKELEGHQVTVVGEVPRKTVEMILDSVALRESEDKK